MARQLELAGARAFVESGRRVCREGPACSALTAHVVERWTLLEHGRYFDVYLPPVDGTGFRHDTPVLLFDTDVNIAADGFSYDAAPDGKRFLFMAPVEDTEAEGASVHLVQGWRALLE